MINKFNSLFVTLFGVGKVKFAPGTIASLLTTIFFFYLIYIVLVSKEIILFFLILIFLYSIYAISTYIKNKDSKDPKEIVIDEVIGQSIPLYMYEIAHGIEKDPQDAFLFYICIFILFRFFDIKKPYPVSFFDKKFKNTFGVIFDDIAAGIYTTLTLVIFMIIKSKLF